MLFFHFCSKLIIILIALYSVLTHAIGSDTISSGESILQNETIVSNGSIFELGFFSPGNSTNYYLGIWYKNIPVQTIVWNLPVPLESRDNSSLVFSNGTLYLNTGLRRTVISVTNATEAVLLDTGNFVLRGDSGVSWQSFDYPSDTWLTGGRIGLDKTNNRSTVLTSWRNSQDPTPGIYSLRLDPSGDPQLFLMRNRTIKYSRSGVWDGFNFTFSPDVNLDLAGPLYNVSYVSDASVKYFTYVFKSSLLNRVVINSLGLVQSLVWIEQSQEWNIYLSAPTDACAVYEACGPFGVCNIEFNPICSCLPGFVPHSKENWDLGDFSSGCTRRIPLECQNRDRFLRLAYILPADSQSLAVGDTAICEFACSINCSCNAYSFGVGGGGCLLWTGDLLDLQNRTNGRDFFLKLNRADILKNDPSQQKKIVRIVIPLFAALLLILGCVLYFICLWRRKLKQKEAHRVKQDLLLLNLDNINNQNNNNNDKLREEEKVFNLPTFSFSSIAIATNNFSAANKLGEGGFGPVYKGSLHNGQSVAVKRLSKMSGQGMEELTNETILIAKLQHRNLVRLLGCCIEKNEKILIYEYMPNKSLDSILFDPNKKEILNWNRRVRIIDGIVQGLLYLHEYSRLRVVHRDLKAGNILLDGDMNPKISDFGMARIFGRNDLHANTNRIVGTYGYMSPEYAMEGRFSIKSDIFAFGILLLEILSGKKNTGFHDSNFLNLLGYLWNLWENDRALEFIDPILDIPVSSSTTAVRCIVIGLLCVQENPDDRPTITDILSMLSNEQTTLALPNKPAFILGRTLLFAIPDKGKTENGSINYVTISAMEAR